MGGVIGVDVGVWWGWKVELTCIPARVRGQESNVMVSGWGNIKASGEVRTA